MLKRLTIAICMLVLLSACSMLSQAQPAPTNSPTGTPIPAIATGTVEPTTTPAPDLPTLWLLDGAWDRAVAIDPQTGRVLNQLSNDFTPHVFSHDGRWRYSVLTKPKESRWRVSLSILDVTRSADPKEVLLSDGVPLTTGSVREVSQGDLLLSKDERLLYVMQSQLLSGQWHTRLFVVDVMAGKVTQSAEVSSGDAIHAPPLQTVLSSDERRLFVVQNFQRQPPAAKDGPTDWFTRITILDLANGGVERTLEVPGDVQAHGFWLNVIPAPDARKFYLLQEIVRRSEVAGYRFVAFDLNQQAITVTRLVERASGGEFGCGTWGLRFTAEGRHLVGYCGADHPIRPAGYVQYLDSQTGLYDPKVALESKVDPGQALVYNISYALPSPDGRWLYIVSWRSREVFVFDVAQRNVVRSIVLKDTKPTSANHLTAWLASLAKWFVGTASAKFYAQPGVLLSPDGHRLYVVDIKDFDKGDGLWAVETATLKPLGHWLAGKDIYGIQFSADGRELFAASPSDGSVQVLDALTGETRRVLKPAQAVIKPMGFVAVPSY